MMETAALIDIGSTYTKAVLIDLDNITILDRSQARTTSQGNVLIGLKKALGNLNDWEKSKYKLACSSAAGGLKIIAIGLVPDLTVEAARRAALGAGSRVLKTYCFELTAGDIKEVTLLKPDIVLLAGGTDGGNRDIILHNAQMIAESNVKCPIIIAGNRAVADKIKYIFNKKDKLSYITDNVMPELEKLNIEPVNRKIREIFLDNIIKTKGLDKVEEIISGIIMPTPSAVLEAASLLARGYREREGIGELLVIDVGGATTDIHSLAQGKPQGKITNWQGLEEPFKKRTVEGDLGIRINAKVLLDLIGEEKFINEFKKFSNNDLNQDKLEEYMQKIHKNVDYLPLDDEEKAIDIILARTAVRIATARHVGSLKTVYTPMGPDYIQEGKDLTKIKTVIGTGGVIVNSNYGQYILEAVLYKNQENPQLLAPEDPHFLLDKEYIMAAGGLLASIKPEKSLQLLKKYID